MLTGRQKMVNRKKETKIKRCFALLLMVVMVCAAGCGRQREAQLSQKEESELKVYLLNKERTALMTAAYTGDTENLLEGLIQQLAEMPDNLEWKAPLQMEFHLLSYAQDGNLVTLNMDDDYYRLLPTEEILVRAALVRTITQIDGVECVTMQVNGEPLTDHSGNPVGNMNADSFVDNEGIEINNYESADILLYFVTEDGNMLKVEHRNVDYNSNIAMERMVLEQLIKGPDEENLNAPVSSETRINAITVSDGICYVDFNHAFLQQNGQVSAEARIYAVVNTLSELNSINKVQISVDGKNDIRLMDNLSLKTIFERNLDLVNNE